MLEWSPDYLITLPANNAIGSGYSNMDNGITMAPRTSNWIGKPMGIGITYLGAVLMIISIVVAFIYALSGRD